MITIREVNLKNGAEFIVAIAGKIMTMPGLPKHPAAEDIDLDDFLLKSDEAKLSPALRVDDEGKIINTIDRYRKIISNLEN